MNGGTIGTSEPQAVPRRQIPWLVFLFLAVVFFGVQHDLYCSLSVDRNYNRSQDEISRVVDQGNPLRRVSFLSLGIVAAACLLFSKSYRCNVNGYLGWLILIFLSWAFLSLTWSQDPMLTARKLVVLIMVCLGAFAASRRFSLRDTILWVLLSTLLYLHVGIATEIILGTFHPLLKGYRFAGTLHPNIQGINCALLFFSSVFALMTEKRRRLLLYVIVCESLIFLVLTKSRTSLVAAVLAVFLYWFLTLPSSQKRFVFLGALFLACLLALCGNLIFPILQYTGFLGREGSETITLTYRTLIWQQAWPYIVERLIEGHGYDSFWTLSHIAEFSKQQGNPTPHAHSVYVDSALSLGIVGGSIFILIVVSAVRRTLTAHRLSKDMGYAFFGVVLVFAALNGFAESAFIQPSHPSFLIMLAMATLAFSSPSRTPARPGLLGNGTAEPRDSEYNER